MTCTGLKAALSTAALRLNTVRVAGCPAVERGGAEGIPAALGRPWLEVQWRAAAGGRGTEEP